MQVADVAGKTSRWEAMVSALEAVHPTLRDLRELFEVKLYTFDGETYPIDIDKSKFDFGPGAVGTQTAIGAALEDVLRHEAGKRLAGVILLSDGGQRCHPRATRRRRCRRGDWPISATRCIRFRWGRLADWARRVTWPSKI